MTVDQIQIYHSKTAAWKDVVAEIFNDVFTPLPFQQRIELLYKYFKESDVLVTSSFGTNSAFLLYWMHRLRPTQKVHFIDTTYHFQETLEYKNQLTRLFNLDVVDVRPDPEKNAVTTEEQMWRKNPRLCCYVNKIAPLEPIKAKHKVWVSGLMGYQTKFRSRLRVFEWQKNILKFHPMIDVSEEEVLYSFSLFNLPEHPLKEQGYGSVGCTHCTRKGDNREGRWSGQLHTECGLHPGNRITPKNRLPINGNGQQETEEKQS